MKLKTITKLYSIFILSFVFLFASCVNNGDEPPKPEPPRESIPLEKKNLVGTWEVYYFTKRIIDDKTGRDTSYRYPEKDGFTVTFKDDGTYEEKNVFGGAVKYASGTYSLGKSDPSLKYNDQIILVHPDTTGTKMVTDYAYVPSLYEDSFAYLLSYNGTTDNGKEKFWISDIYYFRNKKYPDFVAEGIKKSMLKESDLTNTFWELYQYNLWIDADHYYAKLNDDGTIFYDNENVKEAAAGMGQRYYFQVENGSLVFYEFLKDKMDKANKKGDVIINDDIVNMRWQGWKEVKDEEGKVTGKEWAEESYAWWIKDPIKTSEGLRRIEDYNKYRDIKNVLQVKEEIAHYREVKERNAFSSSTRSVNGSTIRKFEVREVAE